MPDPFNLQRFVDAQDRVFTQVCSELRSGSKRSHWMWFIFPQIKGLGYSAVSVKYSISSLEEARAYLDHPNLGPRLRECTRLVNQIEGRSIEDIFGYPDHLKFHSSITLFAHAAPEDQVFQQALEKFFQGESDQLTLDRLRK
ncbi:MAG TPA: DUF1810 domain-containing protein [Terriglobia bacterium]|nr:DUF1810 domain-containing protein [Terriglobia bacterium]